MTESVATAVNNVLTTLTLIQHFLAFIRAFHRSFFAPKLCACNITK